MPHSGSHPAPTSSRIGIVLGSGLGGLAEKADQVLEEVDFEVAGVPAPKVPGHAGRFQLVEINGCAVWLMRGRVHLYEGHGAGAVTAGVRWLASQGVRTLVLTNAAGCLNPRFAPGEWMMLTDHLNLTGASPFLGGPAFHDMSSVYAPRLHREFLDCAFSRGLVLREGVYAGVVGPQYETPAEVRLLRLLGADAVGMSTVLEAMQAHSLGMEVAAFSCLTNLAAGMAEAPLDHADVLTVGAAAADPMAELLTDWLSGQ